MVYEILPDDLRQINHEVEAKLFDEFKYCSRPTTFYLIASTISAVFDIIALLITLGMLGGLDHITSFYFILAFVFLCIDFYLPVWYFTLRFQYPEDVWKNLSKIGKGTIDEARFYLEGVFKKKLEG